MEHGVVERRPVKEETLSRKLKEGKVEEVVCEIGGLVLSFKHRSQISFVVIK